MQRAGDWKSPLSGLKLWKEACTPENGSKEQSATTTEHLGASIIKKRKMYYSSHLKIRNNSKVSCPYP